VVNSPSGGYNPTGMGREIIINHNSFETRVALIEDKSLTEIFIERAKLRGISGNIYKGKVTKVLPGMQVAFVDIGQERAGFLHQKDVTLTNDEACSGFSDNSQADDYDETAYDALEKASLEEDNQPIEEILISEQEVMVQVSKDPIGTKGARISTYITLPGRHLVFMPFTNQVGISRRIEDSNERERLKNIVEDLKEDGKGYIIRTAAESASEDELLSDIKYLDRVWKKILSKSENSTAPTLLHQDLNIVLRSLRDIYKPDSDRVVIDSEEIYAESLEFINTFLGEARPMVETYSAPEPIFDSFGIEIEIERAIGRRVWLKSGGYIVIDHAEALTAIDVNTGRFVGKRSQEDTIVKTNLEAVKEIVYQLKLRNMGGLIIIDFIDMEDENNKEKVNTALELALRQDRSRTKILRVSELGLVEMTRKRTRTNLNRVLCQPCPACDGKGFTKSPQTICYEVLRELQRRIAKGGSPQTAFLSLSPKIFSTIVEEESDFLERLESQHKFKITIKEVADFPDEHFEISTIALKE